MSEEGSNFVSEQVGGKFLFWELPNTKISLFHVSAYSEAEAEASNSQKRDSDKNDVAVIHAEVERD